MDWESGIRTCSEKGEKIEKKIDMKVYGQNEKRKCKEIIEGKWIEKAVT